MTANSDDPRRDAGILPEGEPTGINRPFNKWPPANTPQNRRDYGCAVRETGAPEEDGCWCGAEIIAGFGQCEQCARWLS